MPSDLDSIQVKAKPLARVITETLVQQLQPFSSAQKQDQPLSMVGNLYVCVYLFFLYAFSSSSHHLLSVFSQLTRPLVLSGSLFLR
jgi:hypothetical protein